MNKYRINYLTWYKQHRSNKWKLLYTHETVKSSNKKQAKLHFKTKSKRTLIISINVIIE